MDSKKLMMEVRLLMSKEMEYVHKHNSRYSDVPISEKIALTVQEASKISNIGENKLYEITKNPRCSFVLWIGNKRLIKRKEFEKFISENVQI